MEEQTTTDAPADAGGSQTIQGIAVDDQGLAIAEPQPEEAEPAEAVAPANTEPSQEATTEEEPKEEAEQSAETEDNSTAEWLKTKGVDPNSPEAIEKVAEMARNAEKAMHSKAQKASELEKAIDDGITQEAVDTGINDDDRLDIVRIKTKLNVREFWDNNPEAKQYEQAMVKELATKPHLAGDLESLYANAVVKSGGIDNVKSQASRETLEKLAHKQQAAVPRGNAVSGQSTGSVITPQNVDELVGKNNLEWFQEHREEINKAMAG